MVQRSVVVFTVVKFVGAVYLVWLGVQAIRHRAELTLPRRSVAGPLGICRAARDGLVVGVANPKAFILFGAILPQFIDRSAGYVPVQMLLLGLVSFAIALISDSLWALAASTARSCFARSPRRLRLVGSTGGLAMIGVGPTVTATGRTD